MTRPAVLIPFFAAMLLASLALGQTAPSTQPATTRPDALRAYVVSLGPGNDVWEKFGHDMLWIHDPQARPGAVDAAYNWGLFDFEDHFVFNFICDRMHYWMEPYNAQPVVDDYISTGRTAILQELNLTPQQNEALLLACEVNALPENKFYDYDYYTQNCTTRLRDTVDNVVGGKIRATLEPIKTSHTLRWHTRRLLADEWLADLALDYIEGPSVDRPLNAWEESYLPLQFMVHLRRVQTDHGPLVLHETVLHQSQTLVERDAPPNRFVPYLIIGLIIGALCLCGGILRNRFLRGTAIGFAMGWCLLGTFGTFLGLFTWFFTRHVPPAWNQNYLQLSPLALALLVLLPFMRKRRIANAAWIVGLAVLALNLFGILLKVLPVQHQHNADIIAMCLPANVGLVASIYLRRRTILSTPKLEPQADKDSNAQTK